MGMSTYEKELLVIIFAINKWCYYLYGRPFIIRNDHKSEIFVRLASHHVAPIEMAIQTIGLQLYYTVQKRLIECSSKKPFPSF